jgi:hypothetical protein
MIASISENVVELDNMAAGCIEKGCRPWRLSAVVDIADCATRRRLILKNVKQQARRTLLASRQGGCEPIEDRMAHRLTSIVADESRFPRRRLGGQAKLRIVRQLAPP